MDFDAVVIGAGVGGSAAGAALAGGGKKVLVLEKMDEVGGRCSTAEKNGFEMDTGSHVIYQSGYGPFVKALKRVNMEKEVEFHFIEKMMFKVGEVPLKINVKEAMEVMDKILPSILLKMMRMMAPVFDRMTNALYKIANRYDKITLQDYLSRFTDNLPVHNMLDWCNFILFGTPYSETPAGELMRTGFQALGPMMRAMADGNMFMGYVKGGLVQYPRALCKGIEKHGGEVRTGVTVKRIIVEDGKVAGVETDKGEVIKTNLVMSNAGIKETVKYLVGEEHFDKKYADYIRALIPGCSGWCLRLALDEPVVDYDLIMSIATKDLQEHYQHMWTEHKVPDTLPAIMATSPSRMDPKLAPEGKQSVIVIAPVRFDPEENWPKWEQKALDAIEDAVPGIKDHIIWHDFLTPGTYLIFGEEMAPAIGLAQCMGQAGADRPSSISPVEGLYYVGAEAGKYVSGVATEIATMSGLNAADYVIQQEKGTSLMQRLKGQVLKSV